MGRFGVNSGRFAQVGAPADLVIVEAATTATEALVRFAQRRTVIKGGCVLLPPPDGAAL